MADPPLVPEPPGRDVLTEGEWAELVRLLAVRGLALALDRQGRPSFQRVEPRRGFL